MRVASLLLLPACFLTLLPARAEEAAKPTKATVYIGTYTRGTKSEGIYRCEIDLATGKLSAPVVAAKIDNPTFLTLHPSGKFLYSVGEIADFGKAKTKRGAGAINAFSVGADGGLTLLNQESSGGGGPCHVVTDKKGKHVFGANYGGGSFCCLPILEDGKVGKATGFVQHEKSTTGRKSAPHGHSINLDPTNTFAMAADLGLDKVLIYKYDAEKGTLTANDPAYVALKDGAGPRHFAFHPSGKFAFVNNELDSTVTALSYDAATGALKAGDTLSTLPKPTKGNSTAEVVVHPNGKFVYVSNRGHNSIAIFAFDAATGKLTAKGHQGKGVKIPRNFCLDPTGAFCLVANQDGHDVIVFKVDAATGALEPTEHRIEVRAPVCVRFLAK